MKALSWPALLLSSLLLIGAQPSAPYAILSGTCHANGRVVEDALIQVFRGTSKEPFMAENTGPLMASAATDSNGRWEIPLLPGQYTVVAIHQTSEQISGSAVTIYLPRSGANANITLGNIPFSAFGLYAGPLAPAPVLVFYATDRRPSGMGEFANRYGDGTLRFGVCLPDHVQMRCRGLDENSAFFNVADLSKEHPTEKVVVWIHGYNVSFDDAMRTAEDIALGTNSIVFAYDWTSVKNVFAYTKDESLVYTTRANAVSFIKTLASRVPPTRITIVAHSLGSRVAADMLFDGIAPGYRIAATIFAAADIGRDAFGNDFPTFDAASRYFDNYASNHDVALESSNLFHVGSERVGFAKRPLFTASGLVSIDASAAQTDWLGHGYLTDPRLLRDFEAAFEGVDPKQRSELRRDGSNDWWNFFP